MICLVYRLTTCPNLIGIGKLCAWKIEMNLYRSKIQWHNEAGRRGSPDAAIELNFL